MSRKRHDFIKFAVKCSQRHGRSSTVRKIEIRGTNQEPVLFDKPKNFMKLSELRVNFLVSLNGTHTCMMT